MSQEDECALVPQSKLTENKSPRPKGRNEQRVVRKDARKNVSPFLFEIMFYDFIDEPADDNADYGASQNIRSPMNTREYAAQAN